jgi:hypothetical protein
VDGKVGPETRQALFPLVGVTVNVLGERAGIGLPPLKLPPLTQAIPRLERSPGLLEPIAIPPMAVPSASIMGRDWQQVAQTQAQFTGLFRGPVVNTFAIGVQTVFNKSDADNHVELTTGCLLQGPIGFQDGQGNNFTLACFANATWVDPILTSNRSSATLKAGVGEASIITLRCASPLTVPHRRGEPLFPLGACRRTQTTRTQNSREVPTARSLRFGTHGIILLQSPRSASPSRAASLNQLPNFPFCGGGVATFSIIVAAWPAPPDSPIAVCNRLAAATHRGLFSRDDMAALSSSTLRCFLPNSSPTP